MKRGKKKSKGKKGCRKPRNSLKSRVEGETSAGSRGGKFHNVRRGEKKIRKKKGRDRGGISLHQKKNPGEEKGKDRYPLSSRPCEKKRTAGLKKGKKGRWCRRGMRSYSRFREKTSLSASKGKRGGYE